MADVPTYDNFRVSPQGQTGFSISVPDQSGFDAARQPLEQASRASLAMGEQQAKVVLEAQNRANRFRVMEAANQAREAALHLTFDPNEGYTRVKGGDVLPRDGKPLAIDYGEKFNDQLRAIGQGLSNNEQRELFAEQALKLKAGFDAGVNEHEAREWEGYELSVAEGARQLSAEAITKNWNNPAQIDNELANQDAAVAALGERKGLSASEIVAMQQRNRSAALTQAIASAIESDDLTTASALYDRYKGKLTTTDDIRVKGTIEKEQDGRLMMSAADAADGVQSTAITTTGSAGEKGKPLSNGKAVVEEVWPGVHVNDWKRDPNSALGKANPKSWHVNSAGAVDVRPSSLPAGTTFDQFVGKFRKAGYTIIEAIDEVKHPSGHATGPHWHIVLGEKGSPGGATTVTQRPASLDEMWSVARAHLLAARPDASPELIKATRSEVEDRWRMHEASRSQAEDQSLVAVQQALIKNGGRFNALPASLRNSIPPGKYDDMLGFAKRISEGLDGEPNTLLYGQLVSDPTILPRMTDSQFNALLPQLGRAAWSQLARERGAAREAAIKGVVKGVQDAQSLDRGTVTSLVNTRLHSLGLPTNPKVDDAEAPHVAGIRLAIDRAVLAEQGTRGKKLNYKETQDVINQVFATSVRVKGTFSSTAKPLLSLGVDNISDKEIALAKAALARRGNTSPTDADILSTWYLVRARTR